jgi:predicted Kef-type K+ transport protein
MALGLLSGDSFSVLLSVTLLSMVVTPVLFALANYAARRLGNAE